MGIVIKDQMPAGGCSVCGKYAGAIQSILRKRLIRSEDAWTCRKCNR